MSLVNGQENLLLREEDKMLVLYTTGTVLSTIFNSSDSDLNIWYDFIRKLRPTLRVLVNEDSDFEDEDNPILLLSQEADLAVEADFYYSYTDDEELINHLFHTSQSVEDPCAIVLLDIPKSKAREITEKYGIICHSFQDKPAISPIFQEGIEKSIEKNEPQQGWDTVITDSCIPPSNSLIFVDRYLFSRDSNGVTCQDGLDNVFEVLNRFLPKKFGVDYHVLLLFDATTLDLSKGDTFEKISTDINKLKRRLNRPYNIVIETLSVDKNDMNYEETHNRRILSNYFIIRVDRSLKVFKTNKGLYSQSLWLDCIASKGVILQQRSDPPAKALYKYIKEIRKAITQKKKSCGRIKFSQNGDTHKSLDNIRNRLT